MEDLLSPFQSIERCPVCLNTRRARQYCEVEHYRQIKSLSGSRFGNYVGQPAFPHHHVTCMVCGYEWLERIAAGQFG